MCNSRSTFAGLVSREQDKEEHCRPVRERGGERRGSLQACEREGERGGGRCRRRVCWQNTVKLIASNKCRLMLLLCCPSQKQQQKRGYTGGRSSTRTQYIYVYIDLHEYFWAVRVARSQNEGRQHVLLCSLLCGCLSQSVNQTITQSVSHRINQCGKSSQMHCLMSLEVQAIKMTRSGCALVILN